MTKPDTFPKEYISELFKEEFKNKADLMLINISTTDGFLLHQVNRSGQGVEGDKVAAISSSLCSMSNSAAKELFNDTGGVINVESESGKIVFQYVNIMGKQAIITLSCKLNVSLAEARFVVKRLKEKIEAYQQAS